MILDKVRIVYCNALIDYGTAVGIIAAQSFSAPLTQYMLDAHHRTTTGGTSTGGVVKCKEVLGAKPTSKLSAPSMLVSLMPEFHANKAKAQELANNIEMMNFKQFVVLAQIFFEKYGEPVHEKYVSEKSMIAEFQKYNPLLTPPADLNRWCIRFVLNKTAMILKNINLELIANKLREVYPDTYIVYTPENARQIIMRVYIKSTMFRTVEQKEIERLKRAMLDTTIRGVDGIRIATVTKMIRHKLNGDGSIARYTDRWGVTTLGTNMVGVMEMAGVDPYTCQTNAIEEISRVLGIEAARQRIITEIRNIGVSDVSYRHLSIYADEMTYNGRVTSIERGGLSTREPNNIMLRVGFSAPLQTLEEAGINAMENQIYGLTANLLVGSTPQIGTNFNQYYVNEEFVKQNTVSADKYLDEL
jgi:DNA-directed RNA polymerase beta' subunit